MPYQAFVGDFFFTMPKSVTNRDKAMTLKAGLTSYKALSDVRVIANGYPVEHSLMARKMPVTSAGFVRY